MIVDIETDVNRLCFRSWMLTKTKAYQVIGIGYSNKGKNYDLCQYDRKTKEPIGEIEVLESQIKKQLEEGTVKFL